MRKQAKSKRIHSSEPPRKKSPYSEFFWSVLSPNAGKYGPETTPNTDTFHTVQNI